jgi:hypothetical protein
MTAAIDRYRRKAEVVVSAWRALFGEMPSRNALVRVMSVAEFETKMGDTGLHNWGGVQKRGLRPDEASILLGHGVFPSGGDEALQTARALLTPGPNEILARDTSPVVGPYFTWFWTFGNEVDAARKFLEVLVAQRPGVHAILDRASPEELARAMYASRYYEGSHKDDPEANIRDYARNIRATGDAIESAIVGSTVPTTTRNNTGAGAFVLLLGFAAAVFLRSVR